MHYLIKFQRWTIGTQRVGLETVSLHKRKISNNDFHYLGYSTLSSPDYQISVSLWPHMYSDSRLPPCYLQNSNKYIKKIYWLCDKADCNQLIKLVSVSFSRKEKNPVWGRACPVVWLSTIALFFFTGSKIQQKKLIKSLLRLKKKILSLPPTPLPPPTRR